MITIVTRLFREGVILNHQSRNKFKNATVMFSPCLQNEYQLAVTQAPLETATSILKGSMGSTKENTSNALDEARNVAKSRSMS